LTIVTGDEASEQIEVVFTVRFAPALARRGLVGVWARIDAGKERSTGSVGFTA
jgi:hypothetical protein